MLYLHIFFRDLIYKIIWDQKSKKIKIRNEDDKDAKDASIEKVVKFNLEQWKAEFFNNYPEIIVQKKLKMPKNKDISIK